jgi:hypothetical protein
MNRGILFATDGNDYGQWIHVGEAGLPQGSPLSPILFLFFNTDLVQHKLDTKGGSMGFVDDYTAWVTGLTAAANRGPIEAIVERALE